MKMTSMLPEEESKLAKIKQKLTSDAHGREETRSFLSFPRENLSISQSDLEQGFNKYRLRPSRNTILSATALTIAVLCLGLETWKFHCSSANTRDIEELKRDVESLKHRFLEGELWDKLRTFENQLKESSDDDHPGEADFYDGYYDDGSSTWDDYDTPPITGARPSDFPDSSSTIAPISAPPEPKEKDPVELLAEIIKDGARHEQQYKNSRERHRSLERFIQELKKKVHDEKSSEQNDTEQKRDARSPKDPFPESRTTLKRKRSIGEDGYDSRRTTLHRRSAGSQSKRIVEDRTDEKESEEDSSNTSMVIRGRHPPKKYYTNSFSGHGQSVGGRPKKSSRKLRRNLHAPRRVYAVHYSADNARQQGLKGDDKGNGRFRHSDSVFKAWKPSKWVNDLEMNQYFNLTDGSLTVNAAGLYLAYAQIHYMDEHNEVGFHLLVNGNPLLQCMISNPSNRPNSQSCFSAQLAYLNSGDVLVLKEIGFSRFALLHEEKSFFGLAKLGEAKMLSANQQHRENIV